MPARVALEHLMGVLQGFFVIAVIVGIGYLVGRWRVISIAAQRELSRLCVSVMMPCLLVTMLLGADLRQLFSSVLLVSLLAAVGSMAVYAVIARWRWRRAAPEVQIGALSAGFANAGNIGIPVAVYVLGDAAFTVPVMLLQMAVLTPAAMIALDASARPPGAGGTSGGAGSSGTRGAVRRAVLTSVRNPLLVATVVGLSIAASGIPIPATVIEPFRLLGNASVPLILLAFGMSLVGQKPLTPGSGRRDVLLALILKCLAMPAIAWALALAFGMDARGVLVVTVLAALPTAQNIYAIAVHYGRGESVARDSALLTTACSAPVLLLVTVLLSP